MKYRSLTEDSIFITLGQAALLVDYNKVKLPSSTPYRLDFKDEKMNTYFSIQGSEKEINFLDTLFKINGPAVTPAILYQAPAQYTELRERRGNQRALRQGIAFMVKHTFPDVEVLDPADRDFKPWVRKFE